MGCLIGLALCLACASLDASAQQVYRWIDAKGTPHYSNSPPPPGVTAEVIAIRAATGEPSPDTKECYTIRCQGERMEKRIAARQAEDERLAAERAAAAPPEPRGLEFRRYIMIERGMSEGEVLTIAGTPDFGGDQGIAYAAPSTVQVGRYLRAPARVAWAVATWTYMPTVADPFTTTITFVGGRVSEIQRVRKF
ncbi:MAG: DUF4124 domain-containing protein [Betaproteobacteria bacterium]|jgi:hypothetical protein|nr:DUF4124 domain-containing protein [Betaproteobacteria bacterium]